MCDACPYLGRNLSHKGCFCKCTKSRVKKWMEFFPKSFHYDVKIQYDDYHLYSSFGISKSFKSLVVNYVPLLL